MNYEQQAKDFLESTGTTLDIVFAYTGPYFSDDKEHRDVYQFTLKNDKGIYSASFGDSTHNTERRKFASPSTPGHGIGTACDPRRARKLGFKILDSGRFDRKMLKQLKEAREYKPSAYDILACLGSSYPETFEDFCDEFGYSDQPLTKYPNIMEIYTKCKAEERGLKKLFTSEQLEQLAEIS